MIYTNQVIFTIVCMFFISCTQSPQNNKNIPVPKFGTGMSKISGKYISRSKHQEELPALTLMKFNLITSEYETFEIPINKDGNFTYEIFIPISPDIAHVGINEGVPLCLFNLMPDQETKLEIIRYENDSTGVRVVSGPDFFFVGPEEEFHVYQLISKMAMYIPDNENMNTDTINRFNADPKEYVHWFIKSNLEPRLDMMKKDSVLRESTKLYYANTFKLALFKVFFFENTFSEMMTEMYEKMRNEGDTKALATLIEPDKSYYSFLRGLDLNDPQYLYNMHYPLLCQRILSNKTLNIARIENTPIDEWIQGVRNIIADLIGFDKGQFYDMLIVNAYSRQFIDEMKPLSDDQIQNIRNYYKGGEIEKMILWENDKIVKLNKNRLESIKNVTPAVTKEKLMDAIISRYKNKVVIVDYWATWCAPCIKAIAQSREMKTNFINKDVVFVYITSESSPLKTWEEKIKGIGGEHYYLTSGEWEYLIDNSGFNAIPAYRFYDKEGKLQEQFTGSLSPEKMQNKIESLLSK